MAKLLKWDDRGLQKAVNQAVGEGIRDAIRYYTRECQKVVRRANRDGWTRSRPGEAPHTRHGGPHKGIAWQYDEANRVGIMALQVEGPFAAGHLLIQELGARKHRITPRGPWKLRIPWRADGQGKRQPTKAEIKALGLVPDRRSKSKSKEWVYYRDVVMHPGQAPRPWAIPTLLKKRNEIMAVLAGRAKGVRNFRIGAN